MSKAVYDVVPVPNGWLIRLAGDGQTELAAGKADAINRARQLGRQYDQWRVRVLSASGGVEEEYSSMQAEHPSQR